VISGTAGIDQATRRHSRFSATSPVSAQSIGPTCARNFAVVAPRSDAPGRNESAGQTQLFYEIAFHTKEARSLPGLFGFARPVTATRLVIPFLSLERA